MVIQAKLFIRDKIRIKFKQLIHYNETNQSIRNFHIAAIWHIHFFFERFFYTLHPYPIFLWSVFLTGKRPAFKFRRYFWDGQNWQCVPQTARTNCPSSINKFVSGEVGFATAALNLFAKACQSWNSNYRNRQVSLVRKLRLQRVKCNLFFH